VTFDPERAAQAPDRDSSLGPHRRAAIGLEGHPAGSSRSRRGDAADATVSDGSDFDRP
jgi:hypothetical protein